MASSQLFLCGNRHIFCGRKYAFFKKSFNILKFFQFFSFAQKNSDNCQKKKSIGFMFSAFMVIDFAPDFFIASFHKKRHKKLFNFDVGTFCACFSVSQ